MSRRRRGRPPHDWTVDAQIRSMHGRGSSLRTIANALGVSKDTVRRVLAQGAAGNPSQNPVDASAPQAAGAPSPEPAASRSGWPPPATESTRWVEVETWVDLRVSLQVRPLRVRLVQLWGAGVYVDVDGRVWCPACKETVDPAVLGRWDNTHAVGLRVRSGVLAPMGEGEPPAVWERGRSWW